MAAMAKQNSSSLSARFSRWRGWVQTTFLAVWLMPFVKLHNICGPVFHCYACPLSTFACPIGVLANFSAIHVVPFLALGTLIAGGALFGTFFCGWVCPFGWLQDMLAKIPTPRFRIPHWLGYLRYGVLLGMVFIIPFLYGEGHPLFFCRQCPAGALEGAIPNVVQLALAHQPVVWPSVSKIVILALVLSAMLFTQRPWCGVFCPLGAIYGLCNRVSAVFLRVNQTTCTSCALCKRTCRYDVVPFESSSDTRCNRCLECTRCEAITVDSILSRGKTPSAGDAPTAESCDIRKS